MKIMGKIDVNVLIALFGGILSSKFSGWFSEVYPEPFKTSQMERFAKTVNDIWLFKVCH